LSKFRNYNNNIIQIAKMISLIIFSLFATSFSFHLSPPSASVIKRFNSKFDTWGHNMMSQLQVLNDNQYSLQQSMLEQIAKEIDVLADSEAKFVHNTWSFKITPNYASLDYVLVVVDINESRQVHITGGVVRLNQDVPQQYNIERRCHKVGMRRFLFCGPRDEEVCNNHHVARGLHQHEINHVISHLNSHIPTAQKMLSV